ncbi:MAG: hypothetical protein A4E65_03555 [Syntrophorhabdus sp. PtaU1.Bin153]|nr:MAG: hypothetical protein A4E65_03555 [Syntrophorhabdus sp. PtaU1.Bin153]
MSVDEQAALQLKTDINPKQDDAESWTDVFRGMGTGVTIALIVFWIPFVVIYLLYGWWYVVVYSAMLVIAAAMAGLFVNAGRALKTLVARKTSLETS